MAGVGCLSNLTTSVVQLIIFHKLLQTAEQKSKYDESLLESLRKVYDELATSDMARLFFRFSFQNQVFFENLKLS